MNMNKAARSGLRVAGLACVAVMVGGCVTTNTDGSSTTATFAGWVPLVLLLVCAAMGVVGWMMTRDPNGRTHAQGWGTLLAGVLLLVGAVPTLLLNKVTVTDSEVSIDVGFFWWSMTHERVALANLAELRTESKDHFDRNGKSTDTWLVFQMKDGSTIRVKQEQLLRELEPDIRARIHPRALPAR
jgi:hypothetical protein